MLVKHQLILFCERLGDKTGTPVGDLQYWISKKNIKNVKCQPHPLNQKNPSINFCGEEFTVVWPPEKIEEDDDLKDLYEAIEEIWDKVKNNSALAKLWETFEKQKSPNDFEDFFTWNEDGNGQELKCINIENTEISEDEKKEITDKIARIANRFSLCIYKENDFLFLGDLEEKEICKCINYIKSEIGYRITPKIFVAAHHGTHWHDELKNVYADYVVISNGSARIKDFKPEYLGTGKRILSTHIINRDIEIRI